MRACVYGAVVCAVDFQLKHCGFDPRRVQLHESFFSFSISKMDLSLAKTATGSCVIIVYLFIYIRQFQQTEVFVLVPLMITKMHEECWLRTDAANERGKRVPLFGGCVSKGLQARSGAYIRQGETICDLSSSDC